MAHVDELPTIIPVVGTDDDEKGVSMGKELTLQIKKKTTIL